MSLDCGRTFFVNLSAAFSGQREQSAGFKPFLYAYSSLAEPPTIQFLGELCCCNGNLLKGKAGVRRGINTHGGMNSRLVCTKKKKKREKDLRNVCIFKHSSP